MNASGHTIAPLPGLARRFLLAEIRGKRGRVKPGGARFV